MKKKILLLMGVFFPLMLLNAQVGINTEQPNILTELDVKNLIVNGDTVPKGIMIPRITQKQRDKIQITDKTSANGLFIYNIDEDCYNYYSRTEMEWKSLCGKLGNAQFDPIDCSNIEAKGNFIKGQNVNATNYLIIKTNVKRIGNYTICGTTGNGYYFTISGTALETGELYINVPAQGKPVNIQTDKVSLTGIPILNNCQPTINVKGPIAVYSLNCSSIKVNGNYFKNVVLNSTNTITLNVNVSTPGTYYISTPEVNGVSFFTEGEFLSGGTQQVTLTGKGTPTVNLEFSMEINSNTPEGNSTCTAQIPIILPAMTYAVIGNTRYSWSTDSPERTAALSNSNGSFSPSGTVKIKSFTQLWSTTSVSTAAGYINNGFNGKYPDVILYFAYGAAPDLAVTMTLVEYIKKGGCVIYGSADGTENAVNILMNGVFGISPAQRQIAGTVIYDNTYPIANLTNDPIINGPFGNVTGKHWGEDNDSNLSIILTSLPPNSVQICSAYNPYGKPTVNPDFSIVWYNDSKNFVYFGDCVATTNSQTGGQNDYPSCYVQGIPKSKLYGNYPQPTNAPSMFVYNSVLELNAVAWAIKKAAVSGINPY